MDVDGGEETSILPESSVAESEARRPVESGEVSPVPTGDENGSIVAQSDVSESIEQVQQSGDALIGDETTVVEIGETETVAPTDSLLLAAPLSIPDEEKVKVADASTLSEKMQPLVEEIKRDPNLVSVTLRPVDNGWVMGEDWLVDLHNQLTMAEIRTYVETHRGISRHRIQLRLKGKVVPANREVWTIRRLGIYDGYTIQVEPTLSGAWLWNPKEYYINKLLNDVCAIVESSVSSGSAGRINLKDLNAKIKPPPCIKSSLRVFLRQYPERIYMHTDTTEGDIWVHITKRPFQLPTFGNFSVEIGTFTYYKPKKFDWAGNKDIDDMYKIETLPEEEEALLAEELGEAGTAGDNVAEGANQSQKALLAAEASARLAAMGDNEPEGAEGEENTAENNTNDANTFDGSIITASEEPVVAQN